MRLKKSILAMVLSCLTILNVFTIPVMAAEPAASETEEIMVASVPSDAKYAGTIYRNGGTYVNGVAAYEIVDKQAGKDFYIREDQLAIQRDEKTGMEFLINMDQPFSYNVTMTSELKNLLNDLSDKRNIDIKEIPLQGGLVVNRDSKTGLNYLSIKGNEAQGVSVIITSDKDIETLNKLADEFQKYPVSSQRSTAGLYALLEISGNLKREKDGFTFLTPNGVTYIPYDGDSSKAWEIDMPGSCYATARKCLAAENDCADISAWTKILKGIKIYYGDNYGTTQENNAYKVDNLGRYCMFAYSQ